MFWRELWKSTVSNLAALFGFSSARSNRRSKQRSQRPSPSPAPIVKHKPAPLVGPVDRAHRGENTDLVPQTIDLTPTRPMPAPSAPLRRKPNLAHMDVALDSAAFAALKKQRAEFPPVPVSQTPDQSWPRNSATPVEPPLLDAPLGDYGEDHGPFDPGAPSNNSSNGNGNGYNGHHGGNGDHDDDDEEVALTTLLESLLFVAPEPVEPRQLAQTLDQPLEIIELGLAELADYYRRTLRGLRLQRFNNKVQLVTAPAAAPFIEAFLNLDNSTRLSSPALETLAVIAYRQPVTRAQIEAVRGVDCAGVLRSLVQRGLVAEVGRLEGAGRPILYGVTELFMQHFGLVEMGELPPLEETEADRLWAATAMDEPEA